VTGSDKLKDLKSSLSLLKQEINKMHMKESLMRTQVERARERVQTFKVERKMKANWNA